LIDKNVDKKLHRDAGGQYRCGGSWIEYLASNQGVGSSNLSGRAK
jgi:hypothetical protein